MKHFISGLIFLLLLGCAKQGTVAICEGCETEDLQAVEQSHVAKFTAAMQQTLAQLHKEKTGGMDDPDKIEAMQVLAKTDAAKSYAFTQIYAVSAEYCDADVQELLTTYQSIAANIIALGNYYYQQGIEAQIGGRDLSQSGQALTAGLKEMTDQLLKEHETANQQELESKCMEAKSALNSLSMIYGKY